MVFNDLTPDNTIEGGTDGTPIGNVGDRLKTSPDSNPTSTGGCPVISSKLRVEVTAPNIQLSNVNQSYSPVYDYDGSGKFFGFAARFNSNDVYIRLEIDGEEIFNIDCGTLGDMDIKADKYPAGSQIGIIWNEDRNSFTFNPSCPVVYSNNVTIESKANSDSNDRDLDYLIVQLTKET